MTAFPDHATRILYHHTIARKYPGLNDLLAAQVFTEKKISALCEWVFLWLTGTTQKQAIDHVKNYLDERQSIDPQKRLKIAFVPGGGFFRTILASMDLDHVHICGVFDSGLLQPFLDRNIAFFPIQSLRDAEPDVLIVASDRYGRDICRQIEPLLGNKDVCVYNPFWEIAAIDGEVKNEIEAINRLCDTASKRPVLVFVCLRFYSFLYKRLLALKKAGLTVILISLEDHVSHAMALDQVKEAVAYTYSAKNHLFRFLSVLKSIRPDLAHFFLNAGNSQIPAMVSCAFTYPYVVEYNDVLTNMHDRQSLARSIGEGECAFEFAAEKFLISRSRGVVYNNHVSSVEHQFAVHDVNVPTLEFLYYPLNPAPHRSEAGTGKIRLVYIGGITRSEYDHMCNYSFADTLAMIDILTGQGFTLDIFNAYDSGDSDAFFELKEKQKHNPYFRYHKAVHPKELPDVLTGFDVGFFVQNYSHSKMKTDVLKRTMSSRLNEYFEAGLLVVISEELEYMADIVERNGLGLVTGYDRLHVLSEKLTRDMIRDCAENVRAYVDSILMKGQVGRILDFYAKAVAAGESMP